MASTHPGVDLLHIDIAACPRPLKQCVSSIVVGTHSRQIEGRIFDSLLAEGWILEIERPAILNVETSVPFVTVDGVQGWRNPTLIG